MHRAILNLSATYFLALGTYMLIAPLAWYDGIPGVPATGPFNSHFVRDIAFAFLVSAATIGWATAKAVRSTALAGIAWPCLHALFHLQVWIARGLPLDLVATLNLTGIQLPAWLALWAAWRLRPQKEPASC